MKKQFVTASLLLAVAMFANACEQETLQGCETTADCPSPAVCQDGACIDLCANVICAEGRTCNPQTGRCYAPKPNQGCSSNAECLDADRPVCLNGVCSAGSAPQPQTGCTSNAECAVSLVGVQGICGSNGQCQYTCLPNNCPVNNSVSNGCEPVGQSVENCLGCGVSCGAGQSCVNGACVTAQCGDGGQKCENNTAYVCTNGQWTEKEVCQSGCNGLVCDGSKLCNDGDKKCENNTAHVCGNGIWDTGTACELGCNGTVCAENVVECVDGSKKCENDKAYTCVNKAWSNAEDCAYGCDGDECASEVIVYPGPTGGNVGDSCNEATYVEGCNANVGLYCYEGVVSDFECDADMPCQIRAEDFYADCADSCNKGDEPSIVCLSSNGSLLAVSYNCDRNVAGGYSYFMDDYEICNDGCTDGTGCDGSGPSTETGMLSAELTGNSCNASTYAEVCQDNLHGLYCDEGDEVIFTCAASTPCAIRAEDGYSDCVERCEAGAQPKNSCLDYQGYLLGVIYECKPIQGGGNAYFLNGSNYEICEAGCTEGVGCNPVEKCDDSYVEHCEGNVGYYCSDEIVTTFECDASKPCAVRAADNYSDCAAACEKGSPDTIGCMDYSGSMLAITYSCAETTSGSYASFMGNYEICEGGCTDGVGCDPIEACDPNTYVEYCQDNVGYYCSDNKVTKLECDDKAPCAVRASDNYSDCAAACNAGDPSTVSCMSYFGLMMISVTYNCEKTTDGSYASFATLEYCDGDCTEGVGCAAVETCDDSYVEYCDGNVGYYCSEGKVANFECDATAPCAVRASDNYSDCASACTEGTPDTIECMDYYGSQLAVVYSCSKTTSGSFASFMGDYQFCDNGCTDGVGCK